MLLTTLFYGAATAQTTQIYMPREYKKALEKGTRSLSGTPGPAYFQNRADYTIEAAFNPLTRVLTGKEIITYFNNSPDSLRGIVLNIDHDIFKAGTNRVYEVEATDLTDGVKISNIKVNGTEIEPVPPLWHRDGTLVYLRLPSPLPPNDQLSLSLDWNLLHPLKTQMRTGTYDSLSFFIAFWFPRIAVYDDVFGWDYTQHLGSGEFYNDFGRYDVKMTLPGDYLMWSTGELQNGHELFTSQTRKRLEHAANSTETVTIASAADMKEDRVLDCGTLATWHFIADNVSDFAFGISKVYQWDQQAVTLAGGSKVLVNAAYPESAEDFKEVASIGANTIKTMSDNITGFPYPYKNMTVFCGHGGMEFPMIVNDGPGDERTFTVFVTAHEISHTWFPFVAGFNETRYGWMDEGLITFLPKKIEESYFPDVNPHKNYMRSYAGWAGREDDINMSVGSNNIANTVAYRQNVYGRAAAAFYHLADAMGKDNFDRTLKVFLSEWTFRHPSPWDFMNTCSRVSGEDLSWYFGPWFYENAYPDLSIGKVETTGAKPSVEIVMNGRIPVPVKIRFTYNDGTTKEYTSSVRNWRDGNRRIVAEIPDADKLKTIELGDANIPDAFPKDNSWHSSVNN